MQFYHSTTRKLVIALGTLFNNIYIERRRNGACEVNDATSEVVFRPNQDKLSLADVGKIITIRGKDCFLKSTIVSIENSQLGHIADVPPFSGTNCYYEIQENIIKIPCSYSPREKFIRRFEEQPDISDIKTQITLPRIGFELKDMQYDERRKLNKIQRISKPNNCNPDEILWSYERVPYNFSFHVYVQTRYLDDMYQILEQVSSFFTPEFTVTLNDNPDLNIKSSVPFSLLSIDQEDSYDGSMEDTRYIISTLSISAKASLFGPTHSTTQSIIKKAIIEFFDSNWDCDNLESAHLASTMIVEPSEITFDANVQFPIEEKLLLYKDITGQKKSDGRSVVVRELNNNKVIVKGDDVFLAGETLIGAGSSEIAKITAFDERIQVEIFDDND